MEDSLHESNEQPVTNVALDQLPVTPPQSGIKENISKVSKKTKQIIFWLLYVTISLGLALPPLISGGIWETTIQFHMIQSGPAPTNVNNTLCLVVCDYYEGSICGLYPPIWLIICGCSYSIGFILAAYPLYYFSFVGFNVEGNGDKSELLFLLTATSVILLGLFNVIWGGLGISQPTELFDTGVACVEDIARMIYAFAIINFIVAGISFFSVSVVINYTFFRYL